jgi:hypothetical protein
VERLRLEYNPPELTNMYIETGSVWSTNVDADVNVKFAPVVKWRKV